MTRKLMFAYPKQVAVALTLCNLQMTRANAGSLLVFDASKIDLSSATDVTPSGDAVEGIVTERGETLYFPSHTEKDALCMDAGSLSFLHKVSFMSDISPKH